MILVDYLGLQIVALQFVPKLFSFVQREICFNIPQDMVECTSDDPDFLKTVI